MAAMAALLAKRERGRTEHGKRTDESTQSRPWIQQHRRTKHLDVAHAEPR